MNRISQSISVAGQPISTLSGLEIGEKITGGRPTGEQSIRVLVSQKLPASKLAIDEILPATIDGVPVDVVAPRCRPTDSSTVKASCAETSLITSIVPESPESRHRDR
jgi:hypothetical protein